MKNKNSRKKTGRIIPIAQLEHRYTLDELIDILLKQKEERTYQLKFLESQKHVRRLNNLLVGMEALLHQKWTDDNTYTAIHSMFNEIHQIFEENENIWSNKGGSHE